MEYYKEHVEMYVDDNMFLDFYASVFLKHYIAGAGIATAYVDDKMFLNFYVLVFLKQHNVAAGIGIGADEKDIYKY
eukprot:272187-Heterocapsa_arctica.AAC.1